MKSNYNNIKRKMWGFLSNDYLFLQKSGKWSYAERGG